MKRDMLTEAQELAAWLGPVHPLAGKVAVLDRWEQRASRDPDVIAEMWKHRPDANIGLLPEGRLVGIDIDPRDGGDNLLRRLEQQHAPLPPTLTCRSGGADGGRHLYLLADHDVHDAGNLGRGFENPLRPQALSRRGALDPPETGRPYEWEDPSVEPARLPSWVLAELAQRTVPSAPAAPGRWMLGPLPAVVEVSDVVLLELLDHARGPAHDMSAQDFAIACRALERGYSDEQAAALVLDHRERHGDRKPKTVRDRARDTYLARTIAAAHRRSTRAVA